MLINAMGLILADKPGVQLSDLTKPRALAAVPFFGRFRLIDFMLSNMVNSDLVNVGVLTRSRYRSLMDHLGTGLFWDLDRMKQGLTLLTPFVASSGATGNSSDLTGLFEFLLGSREEYVVISDGNLVVNIDLKEILNRHIERGADMTVLYHKTNEKIVPSYYLSVEDGLVTDLMVDKWQVKMDNTVLGILVISRRLLISIVADMMAHGQNEFSIETLLKSYARYRIQALEYNDICLVITNLASYFKANLLMLQEDYRHKIFHTAGRPIFTKIKNEAPAYYEQASFVSNSVISDGCSIHGSVCDSILFRGAHVGKGSNLERCIIFQNAYIAEGAKLHDVILDKNTFIQDGISLQGQMAYPVVIEKGARV